MREGKAGSSGNADLRRLAEERMKAKKAATRPHDSKANQEKILQELEIHQIELEMQNEELIQSKVEMESLMADYLDIFDFAPIGYFTLTPDGVIVRVNLTGAAILGVVRSRLVNQELRLHLSDESHSYFETFLKKTFEGKAIESCEFKLLNGERQRFVQLEARLSEDKKKCRLAMIDITERRQIEAKLEERTRQLEELNKELESFSYSVSHDLRAPLRAIDGYSRIILRKGKEEFDEDVWDKFQVIRSNVQKMNQLIEDLLSFAHLARLEPRASKLDMQDLFQEAWREQQNINTDRVMQLKINNLPPCVADRNLMKQVCTNILSNAVKFTMQREVALIEAGGYVERDECVYFVKDNGAGFDMAYHDKLFGVFQRLHSDTEFEGTGIGLALVKRIINRHGGRIWAEGKEGKGATFYFTLPITR
jgi:PAS domain S-box-containing protein